MSSFEASTPTAQQSVLAAGAAAASVSDEEKKLMELTSADYYFDSYSHFGIHEEMLKDEVRTRSYMRAIVNNPHLFKDKVVLDVGCGTGILCMFAAKAGAKHVYGVDCAGIIDQAREIVASNGFSNITLIRGKVEDIQLPVDKVDIIISEWMGYFLLYESMLDTVLVARDRWLAPGGLIFPDRAQLYLSAIEDQEYRNDKIDFWDNVYGFNMSVIKKMALMEPLVDMCDGQQVMSTECCILDVDIYTVKKEDLDFSSKFSLKVDREDYCHALVAYFSVEFTKCHGKPRFVTGPRNKYTHWKQTVFYFEEPIACCADDIISGEITVKRNPKNPRDLDIQLSTNMDGKHVKHESSKSFRLR